MLESEIEKQIVDHVKNQGGLALKLEIKGERGFPDRTLLMPGGVIIFVECKRPNGGRVSPQQRKWIDDLTLLGFSVHVARGLEDIKWS